MVQNDLTIKISPEDDGVNPHTFITVISSTIKLLESIDCEMTGDRTPSVAWRIVRLGMSSPAEIVLVSHTKNGRDGVDSSQALMDGMRRMETTSEKPRFFSEESLVNARRLSRLVGNGRWFQYQLNGDTIRPTGHIAANIDAVASKAGQIEDMCVDGRLEAVYVHGGNPQFQVFDPITDKGVKCYFPDEDLDSVIDLLKSRVRVYGLAKFNKKDEILSVQVDSFEKLPEQDEVPSIEELHDAKIDITGDEDSADYVRRIRNE